jgi:hypothetical protein
VPEGHLQRIPYAAVLQMDRRALANAVAGKTVFIGATAPAMDLIPTPVSGERPMPGVEVNANVYLALRDGRMVVTTERKTLFALTLLAVLGPYLLFAYLAARWAFPVTLAALVGVALISIFALSLRIWFPPMSAAVSLSAAYLVWSFRRLGSAVRFLTMELGHLEREARQLRPAAEPTVEQLVAHAHCLVAIRSAGIYDSSGQLTQLYQPELAIETSPARPEQLSIWYSKLDAQGQELRVTLALDELSLEQEQVLVNLARKVTSTAPERAHSTVERIEQRMQQVRTASEGLTELRNFVSESLKQMPSEMVVADGFGQVREANANAALFAGADLIVQLKHLANLSVAPRMACSYT